MENSWRVHGRLLEKDELLKLVWPDTFVAAAWRDIQEIVGRNKLRPGEAEMSPEGEEDFILQEIKAARAEERA